MAWTAQVKKLLEDELFRQTKAGNLSRTFFWQLSLDIDEETLDEAEGDIGSWIAVGKHLSNHKQVVTAVLLYNLRNHLFDVSHRRLWPAVASRFSREEELTPERTGTFFRKLLEECYPGQLASIDHRFRFVYLLVDQAGIGRNRKNVIREYLLMLIDEGLPFTIDPDNIDRELDIRASEFIKNQPSTNDADILVHVLRRTSKVMIRLTQALRQQTDLIELSLWEWEQLRDFWFHRSGENLDHMIPEAAEVFMSVLNSIGQTIGRQQFLEIWTGKKYQTRIPSGIDTSNWDDYKRIPLIPVAITRGSTQRDLTIVDETGLSAAQIMLLDSDSWHTINRHYLFWRKNSFRVRIDYKEETSAELIPDRSSNGNGKPLGYFWSGSESVHNQPEIIGTGLKPPVTSKFSPVYRWHLDNDQLLAKLIGFIFENSTYEGAANLVINNETTVAIDISPNRRLQKLEPNQKVHVEDCKNPPNVALNYNNSETLSRNLHFPWLDKCFWVTGTRLVDCPISLHNTQSNKHQSLMFLAPRNSEIESQNIELKRLPNSPIPFQATHDSYHVSMVTDTQSSAAAIRFNGKLIYLNESGRPAFDRSIPRIIDLESARFWATGDCRVVSKGQLLDLNVPHLWNNDNQNDNWLLSVSEKYSFTNSFSFRLLKDQGLLIEKENRRKLDLTKLLRTFLSYPSKLIKMELLHRDGLRADEFSVFAVGTDNEVLPSLPNEPSTISIRSAVDTPEIFKSDTVTDIQNANSLVSTVFGIDDETGITISWSPTLTDSWIQSLSGQSIAENSAATAMSVCENDLVFRILGNPNNCTYLITDSPVEPAPDDGEKLVTWLELLPESTLADVFDLRCCSGTGSQRVWHLDARPTIHDCWIERSEKGLLTVNAQWTGIQSKKMDVSISLSGNRIGSGELVPTPREDGQLSGTCTIVNTSLENLPDSLDVSFHCRISFGGKDIFSDFLQNRQEETLVHACVEEVVSPEEIVALVNKDTPRWDVYLLVLASRFCYTQTDWAAELPTQNIISKARNNSVDHEQLAMVIQGLKILTEMNRSSCARITGDLKDGQSELAALVNSLIVFNEARKWRLGIADNTIFSKGEHYFSKYVNKDAARDMNSWVHTMTLFCKDCQLHDALDQLVLLESDFTHKKDVMIHEPIYIAWTTWRGQSVEK